MIPPSVTNKQAADSASFHGADAVNGALQQTPAVRLEAVERARTLISDNNYPPQSTIKGMSKLVAEHLASDTADQ
jgi:hypothetical protein